MKIEYRTYCLLQCKNVRMRSFIISFRNKKKHYQYYTLITGIDAKIYVEKMITLSINVFKNFFFSFIFLIILFIDFFLGKHVQCCLLQVLSFFRKIH